MQANRAWPLPLEGGEVRRGGGLDAASGESPKAIALHIPIPNPSPLGGEGRAWRPFLALILAFTAAFSIGLAPAHAAALKFPALTGRVVDDAHVLPADEQARLTQKLADLESRTSRQLVVVTVPSLQGDDIADYGYKLGRQWQIGQKGTNNGTLFIIAPTEHQTRIEVGYGLEGVLTDAVTSVIIQSQVLPRFKAGDIPGGVEAGTDALIEQMAADPSQAEQKAAAAKAQVEAQDAQPAYHYRHRSSPFGFIFPLIFVFVVFGGLFGRGRRGGGGLWPLLFLGGMMGGGGGRDDDWGGGGGGGGGGGFSGGGGSFGGGGSSGSW